MNKIEYESLPDGSGFCAKCNGENIGEITFVKIGIDFGGIHHEYICGKARRSRQKMVRRRR